MFKKLILLITVAPILMIVLLAGCEPGSKQAEGPKTTGLLMKVGREFWPGNYWVDIADKKGWFKEAGLNVEMMKYTGNFQQSIQDWVDGKLDVTQPVFFDFIKYKVQGADLVAVVISDLSFGGDGIVAKKEIESIRDLRGKRVGTGQGKFTEYLLSSVLEKNGMTLADVEIVENQAENIQPFIEGKLDAIVTWGSSLVKAVKKGNGYRIFGSSEIPGLISNIIGFHRKFIAERPGDVQAYVNVWHKTVEFIEVNPKEAFGIIAKMYKITPGEAQALASEDKILGLRDNITAFSFGSGFDSLHGSARNINNFLMEKGFANEQLDSASILDARFIREVKRISKKN